MTGQPRRAKVLTEAQAAGAIAACASAYERAMVRLSLNAGLRAKEIAALTWSMVTDAQGELARDIQLPNIASKGRTGGRTIPIDGDLKAALLELKAKFPAMDGCVIQGERRKRLTANAVAVWFGRHYRALGFNGCSSHSGRRTYITRAARRAVQAGCSLKDVQELAGHKSLADTQKYIDSNEDGKRRLAELIWGR